MGLGLLLCLPACRTGKRGDSTGSRSSSRLSASALAPAKAPSPPSPSAAVTFQSEDGATLAGDLQTAPSPLAPLLVLVHGFRGSRAEWAPLYERLRTAPRRYHVLSFDLRGHGGSGAFVGTEPDWSKLRGEDAAVFVADVRAALRYGLERSGGKAMGVVLVGTSLGAALVSQVAGEEAQVVAVGVVSPGAAIQGYDIYERFAAVRTLPSFIAWASDDNVSRLAGDALGRMAKDHGTAKAYPGNAHSALALAAQHPELWEDLSAWLDEVHDAAPAERVLVPPTPAAGHGGPSSRAGKAGKPGPSRRASEPGHATGAAAGPER